MASSKTDQYRERPSIVVAMTGTETCPVSMMERYFTIGGLSHTSQGRVFMGISKTKIDQKLLKDGGAELF